jgi:hypothetical protein
VGWWGRNPQGSLSEDSHMHSCLGQDTCLRTAQFNTMDQITVALKGSFLLVESQPNAYQMQCYAPVPQ